MATKLFAAGLVLGLCVLCAGTAYAQGPSSFDSPDRYRRPSTRVFDNVTRNQNVSPYLNLTRRRGRYSSQPNYQQFVLPEIERRKNEQQTSAAVRQLQNQVAASQNTDQSTGGSYSLRGTGHTSQFFYYSHFFPPLSR